MKSTEVYIKCQNNIGFDVIFDIFKWEEFRKDSVHFMAFVTLLVSNGEMQYRGTCILLFILNLLKEKHFTR